MGVIRVTDTVVTWVMYESGRVLLHRFRTSQNWGCYNANVRVIDQVVTYSEYESDRQLLHGLSTSHYDCCYRGEVRIKDKLLHDKK